MGSLSSLSLTLSLSLSLSLSCELNESLLTKSKQHNADFHPWPLESVYLVIFRGTWIEWPAQKQFRYHTTQGPHVYGFTEWKAQQDLRGSERTTVYIYHTVHTHMANLYKEASVSGDTWQKKHETKTIGNNHIHVHTSRASIYQLDSSNKYHANFI